MLCFHKFNNKNDLVDTDARNPKIHPDSYFFFGFFYIGATFTALDFRVKDFKCFRNVFLHW